MWKDFLGIGLSFGDSEIGVVGRRGSTGCLQKNASLDDRETKYSQNACERANIGEENNWYGLDVTFSWFHDMNCSLKYVVIN